MLRPPSFHRAPRVYAWCTFCTCAQDPGPAEVAVRGDELRSEMHAKGANAGAQGRLALGSRQCEDLGYVHVWRKAGLQCVAA